MDCTLRLRHLMAACTLAVLLGGGCERRVEEPGRWSSGVQTSVSPTAAAASQSAPSASLSGATASDTSASTAPSQSPPRHRCVDPTPGDNGRRVRPGPDPRCPPDSSQRPMLRRAVVHFVEAGTSIDVEVAERDDHRQRGLMFRRSLPEDEGMLFIFKRRRVLSFWMRNTCIPLDMLFVDRDGLIVGIQQNVPTMNDHNYAVQCPSVYVVEVNAGWSRRHGVQAGQRVELVGL